MSKSIAVRRSYS